MKLSISLHHHNLHTKITTPTLIFFKQRICCRGWQLTSNLDGVPRRCAAVPWSGSREGRASREGTTTYLRGFRHRTYQKFSTLVQVTLGDHTTTWFDCSPNDWDEETTRLDIFWFVPCTTSMSQKAKSPHDCGITLTYLWFPVTFLI